MIDIYTCAIAWQVPTTADRRKKLALNSTSGLRNRKLAEAPEEHMTFYVHNREFYFTRRFPYSGNAAAELLPSAPTQYSGIPSRERLLLTLSGVVWYALCNGVARSVYFTRQMRRRYKLRSL